MVKLRPFLCVLGASASTLLAQAQTPSTTPQPPPSSVSPAPIPPPIEPPPAPAPTAGAAAGAGGQVAPEAVAPEAGGGTPSNAPRSLDFAGDDLPLILRTLARQAGMNIVVSDKVLGTVTMRLENKTPREAIQIIVDSKGLVMDERNGVYSIKTVDERHAEPAEPANYTFSYAVAKDVQPLLDKQLTSAVASQIDVRTNTIFYRETKANMDKISEFLLTVDRPTKQVMIEARLVEVTANPQQNYGINWAGVVGGSTPQTFQYGSSLPPTASITNGQTNVTAPATVNFTNGTASLNSTLLGGIPGQDLLRSAFGQFAILSVPQMSITTRLLNEDSDAEFLANPRVVTSNNMKAEIKITRAQPVPELNFNEQSATAVFSGFKDVEFGNTLSVTPTINKDNFVTLAVKPEISNKVGDETFTFQGAAVTSPIIDKRTLDSNVLIRSGDTLAIGGLLQDEVTKGRAKVPILGDIPVLGYAFQDHSNQRTKRNLLIFVTPTIIEQGYGTGLEDQVSGIHHSGDEMADPNGWRNNAKGAVRLVPTSNRQVAADYPAPGIAPAPHKPGQGVQKRKVVKPADMTVTTTKTTTGGATTTPASAPASTTTPGSGGAAQ